jgi:hypothetical protein
MGFAVVLLKHSREIIVIPCNWLRVKTTKNINKKKYILCYFNNDLKVDPVFSSKLYIKNNKFEYNEGFC